MNEPVIFSIKKICGNIQRLLLALSSNILFQIPILLVFLIPVIATLGQYFQSGFIANSTSVLLLFWPGVEGKIAVDMPVWLIIGLILIAYVAGLIYLVYRRNLGKAALIGIAGMLIGVGLAALINSFTGWTEVQGLEGMELTGKANKAIFSLWHNPVWEEVIFRGIPLLILIVVLKFVKNKSASFWLKAAYIVIPSVIFALYHIPNHGYARIADTFVAGLMFTWLALKFTFFAPLVLHCIFDAMSVQSLGNIEGFPLDEIPWIIDNQGTMNTVFTIAMVSALVLAVVISIRYIVKKKKSGRIQVERNE